MTEICKHTRIHSLDREKHRAVIIKCNDCSAYKILYNDRQIAARSVHPKTMWRKADCMH